MKVITQIAKVLFSPVGDNAVTTTLPVSSRSTTKQFVLAGVQGNK